MSTAEDLEAIGELASQLDEVLHAWKSYGDGDPWIPGSLAASEYAQADDYSALPWKSPMGHVLITPLTVLGVAKDHLVAYIAVLRAPDTVLALMSILRVYIASLAQGFALIDPTVGVEERVRRVINLDLESDTEKLNFIQRGNIGFDGVWDERAALAAAAAKLGYKPQKPGAKATSTKFPSWYVGAKPKAEMQLVRDLMSFLAEPTVADSTYRLLSAVTHAQLHGVVPFIARDLAVQHDQGFSTVPGAMSGQQVVLWSLTITSCLDAVLQRCFRLYGWSPVLWNSVAPPLLQLWANLVRV